MNQRSLFNTVVSVAVVAVLFGGFFWGNHAYGVDAPYFSPVYLVLTVLWFFLAPCLHELGHLCAGLLAKMRFCSLQILFWQFESKNGKISVRRSDRNDVYGACNMLPTDITKTKDALLTEVRGGVWVTSACFALGVLGLVLSFFGLLESGYLFWTSGLWMNLHLFITNVVGNYAETGKTDGCFLRELKNNSPEAEVTVAVLSAQAELAGGKCEDEISTDLTNLPVIREDDPAFVPLLNLRFYAQLLAGRYAAANKTAKRWKNCETVDTSYAEETFMALLYAASLFGWDRDAAEGYFDALPALMEQDTPAKCRVCAAYAYTYAEDADSAKRLILRGYELLTEIEESAEDCTLLRLKTERRLLDELRQRVG